MQLTLLDDELAVLIERVVARVLAEREVVEAKMAGRFAFSEREAADVLGIRPYVLRDARLRGEIEGTRLGRRVLYSREQLLAFFRKNSR